MSVEMELKCPSCKVSVATTTANRHNFARLICSFCGSFYDTGVRVGPSSGSGQPLDMGPPGNINLPFLAARRGSLNQGLGYHHQPSAIGSFLMGNLGR